MKRQSCLLPIAICAVLLSGCAGNAPETESRDLFAMDTYMTLKVTSADADALLTQAAARIEDLEETFSVNRPESDVARINAADGKPVEVSADTLNVLQKACEIGNLSGGSLDVTLYPVLKAWGFTTDSQQVPEPSELEKLLAHVDYSQIQITENAVQLPDGMELDLGALAKGYTGDEVMRIFRENGVNSAIISLGGNVQTLGLRPDGTLWKVAVTDPFQPAENLCILAVENQAVITSGNYERYFTDEAGNTWWHILDPENGYPADNGLVSVTVVGDEGLYCDALSTALFVEGTEHAQEHWRRAQDFEMLLVTVDQRILLTEGLQDRFTNLSSLPVEVIPHG